MTSRTTATLILLPGIDGTEVFFQPLIAALPPWIRPQVVTYPISGANGYSDLLPLVETAVADIDAFYVLGWSFSGPLALMLATKEPQRTRGVILSASFVRPPLPVLPWFRFAVVASVITLIRLARRTPGLVTGHWTEQIKRDKAATLNRVPASVIAARAQAILTLDARVALRACRSPVLYLAGSHDRIVPRRNAEVIIREMSTVQVETIKGQHMAMYTNPMAAVTAIARFMQVATSAFQ